MKKFLALYQSSVSAAQQMADVTPEQMKAGMEAWRTWASRAKSAIVDIGTPLGHATAVTGGTEAPALSNITGFSILKAESTAELTKQLQDHPHSHAPGGTILVLEFLPMPEV